MDLFDKSPCFPLLLLDNSLTIPSTAVQSLYFFLHHLAVNEGARNLESLKSSGLISFLDFECLFIISIEQFYKFIFNSDSSVQEA